MYRSGMLCHPLPVQLGSNEAVQLGSNEARLKLGQLPAAGSVHTPEPVRTGSGCHDTGCSLFASASRVETRDSRDEARGA